MRAGASSAVQQTLTSEAASVLKHSLSLARRRGHAQITPLHVAATLLTSRVSLLRRACLKSQSPHHPHPQSSSSHHHHHPLQSRALELCFNVALNRLPTTPGPLLHGQPSLSNALIAALKRAQAHQRRGCIEQQQQQPLVAIKVELEQLILSILDDPSVSRVMREAGFSSTAVKNNLEECSVSSVFQCYNNNNTPGGIYSTPSSPPSADHHTTIWHSNFFSYPYEQNPLHISPQKKLLSNPTTEDIKLVMEALLRKKRRNAVIVGDSVSITEGLVAELMVKVEKGDVPEELKSVHFVKFHFSSAPLRFMKREEVELNISDLKRKVETLLASGGKGVIIYTGDLRWTVEGEENGFSSEEDSGYSPVDHFVAEIGRLLSYYSNSNIKVWLVATANYQIYMRSQMKQPPLDIQWALQPVSVPSGGLGLSLKAASVHETSMSNISPSTFQVMEQKPFVSNEDQEAMICCAECTSNYEKEAGLNSGQQKSSSLYSSSCNKDMDLTSKELPYWLKPAVKNVAEKDDPVELKRKWNKLCQSLHQGRYNQNHGKSAFSNQCSIGKNYSYSSYPWWPNHNSIFLDSKSISFAHTNLVPSQSLNSVPRFRRQQSCHIEFNFCSGNSKCTEEPNLDSLKCREAKDLKITLALGNSPFSGAVNSTDKPTEDAVLRKLLQDNLPWQSDSIPLIADALMSSKEMKKDTWLVIHGNDFIGKRRLALGLSELAMGSSDLMVCINLRMKDNMPGKCSEVIENSLRNRGRIVFLLEDVHFADSESLEFLADSFRVGKMGTLCKKEGTSCQPIFILTKADSTSYSDDRRKMEAVIQMEIQVHERTSSSGTFGSDHKRKANWDLENKSKIPRKDEIDIVFKIPSEDGKKEISRQLSSNTLDLNVKADEEESEDEAKEVSPISSDLTSNDQQNPLGFLELIKNHFNFNRDSTQDRQIREMFLCKIKGSFEEFFGSKYLDYFTVEHSVLEEISHCSRTFLNSLFETWLKDIFQASLKMVSIGRREGISIRLCIRGNGELNTGFKDSCLPKNVPVSYMD